MNSIAARHLRDAGTSKPQSISASWTQKERIITSYRTVSSTRNPSLTIFPYIWTIQAIQWRELWTTKVCMPHSLLLSHDKFMLHKLRPPRFAMSCNSTKKTRKKDPLVNSPITNPPLSFGTEVVLSYPFHGKLLMVRLTPITVYLFHIRFGEMSAIEAKADSSTDEKINETSRS